MFDNTAPARHTSAMSRISIAVLKLPDFRRLLLTRTFALMALQAQAIIVGWQVYSITKDPLMLGLFGLIEAAPAILSALYAGHVVDHSRPHRVYLICVGVLTLNTLMLWLLAGGIAGLPGVHVLLVLYSGAFISGLARAFIMPSSFSLLPQIVPRADISAAAAWLSTGFEVATIGGPAIAGILFAIHGAEGAWLMPVVLLCLSFAVFSTMSARTRHYKSNAVREAALQSILGGWRFILQNPVLLSVMALDMFAVLFGGAVAMLPAFADDVLHVGAGELGMLRAAPAIGAVTMALYLAFFPFKVIRATTLLVAVVGFGLAIIGFGFSTSFWVAMGFLALTGLFDAVSVVIRSTMVQLVTTDAMRGRVSSVNTMFIVSSNEIGAFRAGFGASAMGLVTSIVSGGVICVLIAAFTASLSPKFRRAVIHTESPVP